MKLSKLSIAISSSALMAVSVTAFTTPSPLSSVPTSKVLAVAAASQDLDLEDAAVVKSLSFRELQSACKKKGLPAVGNTATLRNRLLETLPSFASQDPNTIDSTNSVSTNRGRELFLAFYNHILKLFSVLTGLGWF